MFLAAATINKLPNLIPACFADASARHNNQRTFIWTLRQQIRLWKQLFTLAIHYGLHTKESNISGFAAASRLQDVARRTQHSSSTHSGVISRDGFEQLYGIVLLIRAIIHSLRRLSRCVVVGKRAQIVQKGVDNQSQALCYSEAPLWHSTPQLLQSLFRKSIIDDLSNAD